MLGYSIKRILQVFPVLLVISFICFMMIRLVPGDPVANMLGPVSYTHLDVYKRQR